MSTVCGCSDEKVEKNETFTVRLVALKGSDDPSKLNEPIKVVRRLVLGLTEKSPQIEEIGDNLYKFTIEGKLIPSATARIQTPVVHVAMYGSPAHTADNQPIPDNATLVVDQADMQSIYLEKDRLGQPFYVFEFTPEGRKKFERYTTDNVGNYIMIGFEGRVINWIPIKEPVKGSQGLIEGRFRKDHAERYLWGLRQAIIGYRLEIVKDP
ncbi:MAG: hypothetical protein ABIC40_06180 [bacterium]